MEQQEFTALQVTVLVRTQQGAGQQVKEFFDSVQFQYDMQDTLGRLMKEQLKSGEVDFDEVIISLDNPAERAKGVRTKSSLMRRLLGNG